MNVPALRWFDRVVGVPLCAVLTLHRQLARRPSADRPPRRILFVKLAERGSTVLAAEAVRRAVALVGRENVFFVVFDENRDVLDAMGQIPPGNALSVDVRSLWRALRTGVALLRHVRKLTVDSTVALEFFSRSGAILSYLSGASRRVGVHAYAGTGPYCGDLYTHRLVYNPYLHASDWFVVLVAALGQPADRLPTLDLRPPSEPVQEATAAVSDVDMASARALLLREFGRADVPALILLNANSSDLLPLRRWPPERYVELARRLLTARQDLHVAFTGAPDEAGAAEGLAGQLRAVSGVPASRCVSLAGKTTFGQLLALYHLADVLVTNDSGPAHFGTLTPIGVVTLFGPETPTLFAARVRRNRVLWAGLACSPCVNAFNNRVSRCRDNVCMQRITIDAVFETTLAAFDARRATRPGGLGPSIDTLPSSGEPGADSGALLWPDREDPPAC